jgi:WD40 repeat protein
VELHHADWVLNAAFNPDGTRIVTASRDGIVRLWSPERSSREPLKMFRHPHQAVVFSAAFSPDGSRIVTAAGDGVARVWSIDSGESLDLRHTEQVNDAAFSPSGAMVVTASKDRTARLWSEGSERLVLPHGSEVRAAAFDRSESRVVTGTADGVVRVWRVTLPGLKEYLRQVSTACITPAMREEFLGESAVDARARYEACEGGYGRTPSSFAAVGSGSVRAGHSPH